MKHNAFHPSMVCCTVSCHASGDGDRLTRMSIANNVLFMGHNQCWAWHEAVHRDESVECLAIYCLRWRAVLPRIWIINRNHLMTQLFLKCNMQIIIIIKCREHEKVKLGKIYICLTQRTSIIISIHVIVPLHRTSLARPTRVW